MSEYEFLPDCGEISAEHYLRLGRGKYYGLKAGGRNFLRVEVEDDNWNPFNSAVVFGRFFCLGTGGEIVAVDLNTFEYRRFGVDTYFGYFLEHGDILFAASACGVLAFNSEMDLLWKNESIAVDGVTFNGVEDGILYVSCEMDPPGGWVDRRLDARTGELLQ